MRLVLRRVYILARAAHRWLFVDMSGEDYFKAKWKPSSSVRHDQFDYEGELCGSTRGENSPGIVLPFWIALAIMTSPVWVPMVLWDELEPKRKRLGDWVESKTGRLTNWLGVNE